MTVIYFIMAAVALGILVFIHELGHYFVAKRVGMIVETFSIGFGRPMVKWRWQSVDWQIGWLPFGGYVKIKGMEFSKQDREKYSEPYEIPNGFFSKAPWRRILVAIAGPLANFILAFLLFIAIWLMGGREKPFAEYSQIIGWVDPQSEIYALGVRPGDELTEYNGKPFTNAKDLLYATMLSGKQVELKGYHVNYESGEKTPFAYSIESYLSPTALQDIRTTGIATTARYLIYDKAPGGYPNPLPEGSPVEHSGLTYQDQVIWANGEVLFSMEQLSHILNAKSALLTVERDGETFLSRQPRIVALDFTLPSHLRNEVVDWQYEMNDKGRWQDLYLLPYVINSEGIVEAPLKFIDEESRKEALAFSSYAPELERPLVPRDRIIAVNGAPVSRGYEILQAVQSQRVQLIAKQNEAVETKVSWKREDEAFEKGVDMEAINRLAAGIGVPGHATHLGGYTLLNPVEPKALDQFTLTDEARERLHQEYLAQKEQVMGIKDRQKRAQALKLLDENQQKLLLGVYLQDRKVDYNPNPATAFKSVFVETGQTLKALIFGYLHPKWLSGPLGIVRVIHHGWTLGIPEALFWISAISVNLGFLNLMPIPVLDGGYVCMSLWEWVTKRRLKSKTMERIIIPFAVLLIGLIVFLTFQDITRLF